MTDRPVAVSTQLGMDSRNPGSSASNRCVSPWVTFARENNAVGSEVRDGIADRNVREVPGGGCRHREQPDGVSILGLHYREEGDGRV